MSRILGDLHHNVRVVRALDPAGAGAANVGRTSDPIDRRGFGALEFVLAYGTLASGAAINVQLSESDSQNGPFTTVVADDLLGTVAEASLPTGARTAGVNHQCVRKIGYKGYARFVRISLVPTVSGAPVCSAVAVLGAPNIRPTT